MAVTDDVSAEAESMAEDASVARSEELGTCALPPEPEPDLPAALGGQRIRAILDGRAIWVNGTTLRYYFFAEETDGEHVVAPDGSRTFSSWVGAEDQRDAVREAFAEWADLGIGLRFLEVTERSEAEIRIGFQRGAGSWVRGLGRTALEVAYDERTMNFGWDLRSPYGRTTARHEIGHALGMPHEHQNPFSGIEWDEDAVYAYFAEPPNSWSRFETHHNILRALSPSNVRGSAWDPDSIMHYSFAPGLIRSPERYRTEALEPPGTISPLDREWVREWYPPAGGADLPELEPFRSAVLDLAPRQQADFAIEPPETREYHLGTFGSNDVVLVLFEEVDGELRFRAGDDDSGLERNALVEEKLFSGRRYVARLRMYYPRASGRAALMLW